MKEKKKMHLKKAMITKNISQLVILFIIVIFINYLAGLFFFRIDLTSEKKYSLSPASKNLLNALEYPVKIRVYLEGKDLPVGFKKLRNSIRDQLDVFQIYAGESLEIEFINPVAGEKKEERFVVYHELYKHGLIPYESKEMSKTGELSEKLIFPFAIIQYQDRETGVELLSNNPTVPRNSEENINHSIETMEYEFMNALNKIITPEKKKILFLEGQGELSEFQVMDFSNRLSEHYMIMRGRVGKENVDSLLQFTLVVVAKPVYKFSEVVKFALDQYIMKGGKVLWLLDGVQGDLDSLARFGNTMLKAQFINIEDQLFKYGARVNYDILLDAINAPIVLYDENSQRVNQFPWPFFPVIISQNNHPVNRYIGPLRLEYTSSVDTVGDNGKIKKKILLSTSSRTKEKELNIPLFISYDDRIMDPKVYETFNSEASPVAVLLEGSFESVYINRLLPGLQQLTAKPKFQSDPTAMIVVADGDIIRNEVDPEGNPYPLGYDRYLRKTLYTGNVDFLLNAVNYLTDESGILQLRSREIKLRLLDKNKISSERTKWQLINTLVPVILIIIFGLLFNYIRKKKYTTSLKT